MYTPGFTCTMSGIVTNDVAFAAPLPFANQIINTSYLSVPTGGTEGVIVYVNNVGQTQVWPYAFIGYNPIACTEVLTSAVINGVTYTTSATPLYWHATPGG